ncbi:melanin-concentrating hormone receptor 2 [Engraulis encrasicolus]|uniref:melanin-concentrating hormone receptor 2 n=1 Tax=Engraulis encrasicolus TaxID=184585 RepID=UPI002FD69122
MSEADPALVNCTFSPSTNSSWSDGMDTDEYNRIVEVTETTILPAFVGFLCTTGLVGNILVLVTVLRSPKKTIPDVYMCNLAAADLVHVTVMPFLIHQWARGGHWVFGNTLCTIISSLDNCNQVACAIIMSAMSLDRYLALVHPFRLMSLRTRSKTIWVNLCVWAVSVVLALPAWIHSEVIRFPDGLESCSLNLGSRTALLRYTIYQTVVAFFLPLPLILLCYILILRYTWSMYQRNNKAHQYNTSVPRERVVRLTKTVLVLVSVFLASVGPYYVLQLVNLSFRRPSLAYHTCYYLSVCLSYAASSVNPFIYIMLSGHFRLRLCRRESEKRSTQQTAGTAVVAGTATATAMPPPQLNGTRAAEAMPEQPSQGDHSGANHQQRLAHSTHRPSF